MGPWAPGSVGVVHAANGEPESGGPVTGVAARRRWRDAALASFRRWLEGFGRPARLRVLRLRSAALSLRGSGVPSGLAGLPRELREGRSLPGSPEPWKRCLKRLRGAQAAPMGGVLARVSPWPGKRFRRRGVGLALGLAVPPVPGAGAEGFGCWFARVRRAGTWPRKGPPILSRSASYRQVRRHRPRRGNRSRAAFAWPSRPRLMRRRVVPRPGHGAAGILPLHPAPHSIWESALRYRCRPEGGRSLSWRFN